MRFWTADHDSMLLFSSFFLMFVCLQGSCSVVTCKLWQFQNLQLTLKKRWTVVDVRGGPLFSTPCTQPTGQPDPSTQLQTRKCGECAAQISGFRTGFRELPQVKSRFSASDTLYQDVPDISRYCLKVLSLLSKVWNEVWCNGFPRRDPQANLPPVQNSVRSRNPDIQKARRSVFAQPRGWLPLLRVRIEFGLWSDGSKQKWGHLSHLSCMSPAHVAAVDRCSHQPISLSAVGVGEWKGRTPIPQRARQMQMTKTDVPRLKQVHSKSVEQIWTASKL